MQHKPFAVLTVPRGGTGGTWSVNLTAQSAAISATDLVPATSVLGGLYVVKGIARVTTGALTSSSVSVQINFTDDDGGTAITGSSVNGFIESNTTVFTTPANSTGSSGIFQFSKVINARLGIAIQYVTVYASNPASAMIYNLHLVASRF